MNRPKSARSGSTPQTNLGIGIWSWQPLMQLHDARCFKLWMGLFTTPEAKRWPPGLWLGGTAVMAEATGMGHADVVEALRTLLDVRLVEYDERARVARLVELPPDKPEGTRSGSVVWSWWKKFGGVPPSPVRDAHVLTLRWLADQSSEDVARAWAETFGTMPTPLPGPRPVQGPPGGPRQGLKEGGQEGGGEGLGQALPLPQPSLFPSNNFKSSEGEGVSRPPRDPGGGVQEEEEVKEGGECERGFDPGFAALVGKDLVERLRMGCMPASADPQLHPDLARRRR
jgi:hypothetical protein